MNCISIVSEEHTAQAQAVLGPAHRLASSDDVVPQVIPLTERAEGGARNISVDGAGNWSYVLRDLSPGATYQLHAFTLLHDKESAAYASRNFTTSEYPTAPQLARRAAAHF